MTYYKSQHHRLLTDNQAHADAVFNWLAQSDKTDNSHTFAGGRGNTKLVTLTDQPIVVRQYQRGGLIAKFNTDKYLFTGLTNTRAFREWHILSLLNQTAFAAPQPYAAHVALHGLYYQANLFTHLIPDAIPLAMVLQKHCLDKSTWNKIKHQIDTMHNLNIYHADLNAFNILLDRQETIWIIDFDRAYQTTMTQALRQKNLNRLERSLLKMNKQSKQFYFEPANLR